MISKDGIFGEANGLFLDKGHGCKTNDSDDFSIVF